MAALRPVFALISLLVADSVSAIDPGLKDLRVYEVREAVADWRLQSVVTGGENPKLAFNKDGRTTFATPGEQVGAYWVSDYENSVTRVFNDALGSFQNKSQASVILTHEKSGAKLTLVEGRDTPVGGHVATVVYLPSGHLFGMQTGQPVVTDLLEYTIGDIGEEHVTLRAGEQRHLIAAMADNERAQLIALWKGKRDEQLIAQREAAEAAELEAVAAAMDAAAARERRMLVDGQKTVPMRGATRIEIRTQTWIPPEILYPPTLYMCGPRQPVEGRQRPTFVDARGCRIYRPAPLIATSRTISFPPMGSHIGFGNPGSMTYPSGPGRITRVIVK